MLNLDLEKKIFTKNYLLIAGLDEVGRGPLAGPVVAGCAVIDNKFKINKNLELIKDSKKLTPKKRIELFPYIKEEFNQVSVGICDHDIVDRINILQASLLAMKKALGALKQKPNFLLIDGSMIIPNSSYLQQNIIKGDELVFSIAAASIIAKVTRDNIMIKMHEIYPQYGFDKHKGYGTKMHLEALRKYGPCEIHRKSFKPVKLAIK